MAPPDRPDWFYELPEWQQRYFEAALRGERFAIGPFVRRSGKRHAMDLIQRLWDRRNDMSREVFDEPICFALVNAGGERIVRYTSIYPGRLSDSRHIFQVSPEKVYDGQDRIEGAIVTRHLGSARGDRIANGWTIGRFLTWEDADEVARFLAAKEFAE